MKKAKPEKDKKVKTYPKEQGLSKKKNIVEDADFLTQTYAEDIDTLNFSDIMKVVQEYLYGKGSGSNSALIYVIENSNLTIKVLAEKIFQVTPKTLNSYRVSDKDLPMHIRELSIKIKVLYNKGKVLFGTVDKFNEWLFKPSYGLAGLTPIDLLNSVTGIEMVSDELVSIEFGATA